MCSDCECALDLLIAVALKRKKKTNIRKRVWCKEWYEKRNQLGHRKLLKELKSTSLNDFQNFLRMDNSVFEELLALVYPVIKKQDTLMRESINPRLRLSLTLRYLASGNTFEDLKFLTAIAPYTISLIVMETCEAIIKVLKDYIKVRYTTFVCFISN